MNKVVQQINHQYRSVKNITEETNNKWKALVPYK